MLCSQTGFSESVTYHYISVFIVSHHKKIIYHVVLSLNNRAEHFYFIYQRIMKTVFYDSCKSSNSNSSIVFAFNSTGLYVNLNLTSPEACFPLRSSLRAFLQSVHTSQDEKHLLPLSVMVTVNIFCSCYGCKAAEQNTGCFPGTCGAAVYHSSQSRLIDHSLVFHKASVDRVSAVCVLVLGCVCFLCV